jgi:hypothetical protein
MNTSLHLVFASRYAQLAAGLDPDRQACVMAQCVIEDTIAGKIAWPDTEECYRIFNPKHRAMKRQSVRSQVSKLRVFWKFAIYHRTNGVQIFKRP